MRLPSPKDLLVLGAVQFSKINSWTSNHFPKSFLLGPSKMPPERKEKNSYSNWLEIHGEYFHRELKAQIPQVKTCQINRKNLRITFNFITISIGYSCQLYTQGINMLQGYEDPLHTVIQSSMDRTEPGNTFSKIATHAQINARFSKFEDHLTKQGIVHTPFQKCQKFW